MLLGRLLQRQFKMFGDNAGSYLDSNFDYDPLNRRIHCNAIWSNVVMPIYKQKRQLVLSWR